VALCRSFLSSILAYFSPHQLRIIEAPLCVAYRPLLYDILREQDKPRKAEPVPKSETITEDSIALSSDSEDETPAKRARPASYPGVAPSALPVQPAAVSTAPAARASDAHSESSDSGSNSMSKFTQRDTLALSSEDESD
jgi:hypothetical protein